MFLFNADTIDQLVWPKTEDGEYASRYLTPFVKQGIGHFIENIKATMELLQIEEIVLPIVIANENYSDSWVCSVSTFYISYPMETLYLIENPIVKFFAKNVVAGLGKLGKAGQLNSIVYVNCWLFSTDLYPEGLDQGKIERIITFLKGKFPHHALVFRSLTPIGNQELTAALESEGCRLIASRSVFFTEPQNEEIYKTRALKSDLKLLKESSFEVVETEEFTEEERKRVHSLYRMLYIDNHSLLNPLLKLSYFDHLFDKHLLTFKALKKDGKIEGIIGFFERNGQMMCPLFGYDKEHPESNTLYRLLSTLLLLEAKKRKLLFNQSAGASFFKKIRRAESCIELMAIYNDHLPLRRKVPWTTLRTFINTFAIPYMKKY